MKTKLFLTITLVFLLSAYSGFSQTTSFLKLTFDVKDTSKNLISNPNITVYEADKEISKSNINPFSIKLEFNKEFTIEVSAPSLETKTFLINTNVPEIDFIYKYKFHVILDNISTREKPVAKIFLKENAKDFSYILLK
ncbi:MAG: hypothetical protein ABIJ97_15795 [Bacteroidota bacterium]